MSEKKPWDFTALSLLANVLKKQNIILLGKIADRMNLTKLEREQLFDDFIKVTYYSPKVIVSKHREKLQSKMIR